MTKQIDFPTPDSMKYERYFQIRDYDKDGCGSSQTFCVSWDATEQEIWDIASEERTKRMEEKERNYIPAFYRKPPKWRNKIKVVEMHRSIKKLEEVNPRTGKDYTSEWVTKRWGFKFSISNMWLTMTMQDGSTRSCNWYKYVHKS